MADDQKVYRDPDTGIELVSVWDQGKFRRGEVDGLSSYQPRPWLDDLGLPTMPASPTPVRRTR